MKSSPFVFGRLTTTLCILSGAVLSVTPRPATAQSALQWLQQVPGRYDSQISTGRLSVPGTTEFFLSHTGAIIGTYSIQQDDKTDLGVLHDCQATGSLKLRCIWSDRFGSGNLNLTFSRNANQFNGQWSVLGSRESFAWNGSRSGLNRERITPQEAPPPEIPFEQRQTRDSRDLEPLF